jgi:iron(III) transport system substrate-binding protein
MTRSMTRNRLRITAGVLGIGALALAAGCSSSPATSASSASAAKVTLVVYSAQGYDHAMTTAFQKATGIPVKLDDNSTGPLLTQIEASRNNPNWGLLWVDGGTPFAGLDQQGLLQKGFEPKVSWNSLGRQSPPSDKSYTPTGCGLRQLFAEPAADAGREPAGPENAALVRGQGGERSASLNRT